MIGYEKVSIKVDLTQNRIKCGNISYGNRPQQFTVAIQDRDDFVTITTLNDVLIRHDDGMKTEIVITSTRIFDVV